MNNVEPIRTSDAVELVGRPAGTIAYWHHRGWIRKVGKAGREATWDRVDLLATERDLRLHLRPAVRRTSARSGEA